MWRNLANREEFDPSMRSQTAAIEEATMNFDVIGFLEPAAKAGL